jgi:hypothetical protein
MYSYFYLTCTTYSGLDDGGMARNVKGGYEVAANSTTSVAKKCKGGCER